ncbi:MAG: ROK family protein [Candidatus Omnitrophica bacterium]|nr:ROK family protein [Candidatus Omnitrophota bacterium]MCF7893990.1 ROK family protein [Candidatus Omnitrophota bacterium]
MSTYLGIDWGGTYIKAGVIDSKGKILAKKVYSSSKLREKEFFISEIVSLLASFKKYKVKAIGIGAPGIINIEKGFIYYLPNILGWKKFPLKKSLEKKVKIPVSVDNDANVFALAEARLGAGKNLSRAIFLTLGTGLGSSVIFDQQILRRKTSALELGHFPISLKKNRCGCGNYGCIETFVGNSYLVKRYNKLVKKERSERSERSPERPTGERSRTIKGVEGVKDIYQRGLKGEKNAICIWKEFSFYLGRFLAGMVNIFNPQAIILGGGVSGAYKLFRPYLISVIKEQAMWPNLEGLKLRKAKLKNAGIIGAGLLAKESLVVRKD